MDGITQPCQHGLAQSDFTPSCPQVSAVDGSGGVVGTPEQAPSCARRVSVIFPSLPAGHRASQPTGHHSHASITILLPSAGFLLLTEPPAALSTRLTMKTLFGNDTNMPQLLRGALSQLPKASSFPNAAQEAAQANTAGSSGEHGHRASVP